MRLLATAPSLLLLASLVAPAARAQGAATPTGARAVDESAFRLDAPGTYANLGLSYVLTSGNSRTSSLGLRGDVSHRWSRHSLRFAGGALTAAASRGPRQAYGTPEAFEVRLSAAEPTTEAFDARGRYDYKIGQKLYQTTGAGWERNRFAGVASRWVFDAGMGNVFSSGEKTSFRAALTVSYTDQGVSNSGPGDRSFFGSRLGWDLTRKLSQTSTLQHTLVADQSLEAWSERRADAQFGVSVAMTRALALKVNWRVLYNCRPPKAAVALYTDAGEPTGTTVLAPFEKLDQGFSVSLVLSRTPGKSS